MCDDATSSHGKRNYKSGSQKEKEKAAKKAFIDKLPKLTNFFKKPELSTTDPPELNTSLTSTTSALSSNQPCSLTPVSAPTTEDETTCTSMLPDLCTADIEEAEPIPVLHTSTSVDMPEQPELTHDIGLWKNVTDTVRSYWCGKEGIGELFQETTDNFMASKRSKPGKRGLTRKFTKDLLYQEHKLTGEKTKRHWVAYSPSKGCIFCLPCVLFESSNASSQFTTGYDDWKNAVKRTKLHEDSTHHIHCTIAMITRQKGIGIDSELEKEFKKEKRYWLSLLERLVAVIKYLASRGQSFRGETEELGSSDDGNYLGLLELIAQYDPFLKSHIEKYGNKGKGRPSYLSSTICDEIIEIMGKQVFENIVQEMKRAKYYSLSVDSTPDISQVDQLTVIVRYLQTTTEPVPVERFLTFLPIQSHTGQALADTVVSFLENAGIEIANMRGQSYDNAANMSGCYNGLQAKIRELNNTADYVPCSAHSLSLVIAHAAESCLNSKKFFGFLQALYNFLSSSTQRWALMNKCLREANKPLVVKSLSDTRWSARADAAKALAEGYPQLKRTLELFVNDDSQKSEYIREADGLLRDLNKKETIILSLVWNTILERANATSKYLQNEDIEFLTAANCLKSLTAFITSLRNKFEVFENKSEGILDVPYAQDSHRIIKRKRQHDEKNTTAETNLNSSEKFKTEAFLPIIDRLLMELSNRSKAYQELGDVFDIFQHFTNPDNDITTAARKLVHKYSKDLEPSLENELLQLKSLVTPENSTPRQMLKFLLSSKLDSSFPNAVIALKIYLCIMSTNASGERSFSKLKILKRAQRSTIGQKKLGFLVLMYIETTVLDGIDFSNLLSNFASLKLRKINLRD